MRIGSSLFLVVFCCIRKGGKNGSGEKAGNKCSHVPGKGTTAFLELPPDLLWNSKIFNFSSVSWLITVWQLWKFVSVGELMCSSFCSFPCSVWGPACWCIYFELMFISVSWGICYDYYERAWYICKWNAEK